MNIILEQHKKFFRELKALCEKHEVRSLHGTTDGDVCALFRNAESQYYFDLYRLPSRPTALSIKRRKTEYVTLEEE